MCFENLPIEFDAEGNARLKPGVSNPYAYTVQTPEEREAKLREIARKNGQLADVDFDPVTRVAGALAFHSTVDLEQRRVLDVNSMATLFRGYEVILRGRDPRDAAFISSRACGVCGGVHSTASALSIEMALGLKPPPMGIVVRNLLLSCEYLYDNPLHLFVLAGPDFSESLVKDTNPEIWAKAQNAPAKNPQMHGYRTIGEIMTDLNPLTGKLYLEALQMTRVAREAYVLLGGKYRILRPSSQAASPPPSPPRPSASSTSRSPSSSTTPKNASASGTMCSIFSTNVSHAIRNAAPFRPV